MFNLAITLKTFAKVNFKFLNKNPYFLLHILVADVETLYLCLLHMPFPRYEALQLTLLPAFPLSDVHRQVVDISYCLLSVICKHFEFHFELLLQIPY